MFGRLLVSVSSGSWHFSTLGVTQPTISEVEQPGRDLKLSSLKRYVESAGGKLRLDIELPDGTHYGFNF
ncbi:MAG: helix-turn-helix domain-containing protein [Enterovibrio sp.]